MTAFGRKTVQVALGSMLALLLSFGISSHGVAAAASKSTNKPTKVAATIVAQPGSGNILIYDISAVNYGSDVALYTNVVIPIDSTKLQVVGTELSGAASWLPTNTANQIELRTERLYPGEHATLRLSLAKLTADAALTDALAFKWNDVTGNRGVTNTPVAYQPTYPLTVGSTGASASFATSIFAPDEPVTLWYNTPNGQVVAIEVIDNNEVVTPSTGDDDKEKAKGYVVASNGAIQVTFSTKNLAAGSYSLVARGNWSGLTAVGAFQVP